MDGCVLTIVPGRPALPPDPEPLFPVVTFSVPQLDKAVDTLRLYGVDLPWGVEKNAANQQVMFHDPAGNLVELVELKK